MYLQVEIFTGADPAELQSGVNGWLKERKTARSDIEGIVQSVGPDGRIVLTILYIHHDRLR